MSRLLARYASRSVNMIYNIDILGSASVATNTVLSRTIYSNDRPSLYLKTPSVLQELSIGDAISPILAITVNPLLPLPRNH